MVSAEAPKMRGPHKKRTQISNWPTAPLPANLTMNLCRVTLGRGRHSVGPRKTKGDTMARDLHSRPTGLGKKAEVKSEKPARRRVRISREHTAEFVLVKITTGAVRYAEIDDAGNILDMNDPECKIGTLYIRKLGFELQAIEDDDIPKRLTVTVTAG